MATHILGTLASFIEKYGADATLEDVMYEEQRSWEHAEYLDAFEEDVQYMSEFTLKSMLEDPKTSVDCVELIKSELAQRPRKTAIRMALLDRARLGAFHVVSFYESPEKRQEKEAAMFAHKRVMRLRDYKDMEKNICVYENHRTHDAIIKLFDMINCTNTEFTRFHKQVVALVLARLLRTWWPATSLPLNYSQVMLDDFALSALADFLMETTNSDQTVTREIVESIRHNVRSICSRCGDIETLLKASRDFKGDQACQEYIGAALALALKKVVESVGVDPETNRLHYRADKIVLPDGKKPLRPLLIHKLKIATHLTDDVRKMLAFFPNTDRIGETFRRTRKPRNVVVFVPN